MTPHPSLTDPPEDAQPTWRDPIFREERAREEALATCRDILRRAGAKGVAPAVAEEAKS